MKFSRRDLLLGSASISVIAKAAPAEAWFHHGFVAVTPSVDGKAIINIAATPSSQSYINYAKSINQASPSFNANLIAPFINSAGYINGALSTQCQLGGSVIDPTYYGRYYVWWTGTGAMQLDPPTIVYSGGLSTNLNSASGSVNNNFGIGYAGATTQPTSGTPVEFSFGALLATASTNTGLVQLAATLSAPFQIAVFSVVNSFVNTSVVGNGTTATVTTTLPHGMPIGLVVKGTMAGITASGFNASNVAVTSTGTNTFTYLNATVGTASVPGFSTPLTANFQFNNVTGLGAGPNFDGSWTAWQVDNKTMVLQGSSSLAGLVSINSGSPGTQSEAILSLTSNNGLTITLPVVGGSVSNYTWGQSGTEIFFVKKAFAAAALAGQLANPDYVTALQGLNPWAIRFMDLQAVQGDRTVDYAHRTQPTDCSYQGGGRVVSDLFAGTATNNGSDLYTPASNPSTSPATGPAVDGEIMILVSSGANTGRQPTFQPNRAGATATPLYLGPQTSFYLKGVTLGGTLPSLGTVITFAMSGAGLGSPYSPTYTVLSSDTSFSALAGHINTQFRADATLLAANIVIPFNGAQTSSQVVFDFCRNIGGLGSSDLTVSASDPGGVTTYSVGWMEPGGIVTNTIYSVVYSSLMGGWLPSSGGMHGGVPIEFMADLVKRVGCGAYICIGNFWSADRITQTVAKIANLGVKRLIVESSNEVWNTFAVEFYMSTALGTCLNFSSKSNTNGAAFANNAIRTVLISKLATAAWVSAGRARSDLYIQMPFQVAGFAATSDKNILLNGNDANCPMNCSGSGTSQNAVLAAFGNFGSSLTTDFTASPNRPVDYTDCVSHAPYWNGMQMNQNNPSQALRTSGFTATNYSGLLLASYNYVNGNSTQQAAALDFLYDGTNGDLYNGTIGSNNDNTHRLGSLALGSGVSPQDGYYGVGTVIASYDASRGSIPAGQVGQSILGYICYEGGNGIGPVSGADTTAIQNSLSGLSGYSSGFTSSLPGAAAGPTSTATSDAQNITTLWTAFQLDNRYTTLYLRYLTECKAAGNSSRVCTSIPTQYGLNGPNIWQSYVGDIGQVSQPLKSMAAFTTFNH